MEHEPFEERPNATTDEDAPPDPGSEPDAELQDTSVEGPPEPVTVPEPASDAVDGAQESEPTDQAEEAGSDEPEDEAVELAAGAIMLGEAADELATEAVTADEVARELAAEAFVAEASAQELAAEAEIASETGDADLAGELAAGAAAAAGEADQLEAEAVATEAVSQELAEEALVAEAAAEELADQALEAEAPDIIHLEEAGPADAEEPEPEAEAEEEVPEDASRTHGPGDWYVVHTYSGYENKVKANLHQRIASMQMEDKIFDVVIPMEDVMEIKGGKKQVVQRKVFPGYLLVRMIYDNDSWYVVRNTPGVTGFVSSGTGTKPTPLSPREVQKILAVKEETQKKPEYRLEWEEGDVVRIISGPFADFTGTISEINVEQSKLRVMVNIFDRETPVELAFDQVAKA
jgi:transcriptional antiterminator NusG